MLAKKAIMEQSENDPRRVSQELDRADTSRFHIDEVRECVSVATCVSVRFTGCFRCPQERWGEIQARSNEKKSMKSRFSLSIR